MNAPADKPLHAQVADDVRRSIERGELGPGDEIPSEAELSAKHGVSRQTVRQALKNLAQEGLISGGKGRKRTVRAWNPIEWRLSSFESASLHARAATDDPASDQWATEVKAQGREPRQEIEVSIVRPPTIVAERLGMKDASDNRVVVRRRVRFVDETPYQLADSYFPEEIVRGSPLMDPWDVSAPGGVLFSLGYVQVRYYDEIRVRMPRGEEIAALEMSPGTPVAEHIRTGYDEHGKPLRVMVTTAPGDRYILVYEVNAA